jgi:hypothetical protein
MPSTRISKTANDTGFMQNAILSYFRRKQDNHCHHNIAGKMLYNTFKDVDTIRIKMQFQDFYDT